MCEPCYSPPFTQAEIFSSCICNTNLKPLPQTLRCRISDSGVYVKFIPRYIIVVWGGGTKYFGNSWAAQALRSDQFFDNLPRNDNLPSPAFFLISYYNILDQSKNNPLTKIHGIIEQNSIILGKHKVFYSVMIFYTCSFDH